MKPLLKLMLILIGVFVVIFVIARVTGLLTADDVRRWLEWAGSVDPWIVVALVIVLLALDLVLSIPTIVVTLLAGHFLGAALGALSALVGIACAVFGGYGAGRRWGDGMVERLIPDSDDRAKMRRTFQKHGPGMIVLSRAAPMLPEVTAVLAGTTRMPLPRFALLFLLGTVPYVAIAAYAGSISAVDDPMPAIWGTLLLYVVLWTAWYGFRRYTKRKDTKDAEHQRLVRKWRQRRRQRREAAANKQTP